MKHVCRGMSNAQIEVELKRVRKHRRGKKVFPEGSQLKLDTVKTHIKNAYAKIGSKNRVRAVLRIVHEMKDQL